MKSLIIVSTALFFALMASGCQQTSNAKEQKVSVSQQEVAGQAEVFPEFKVKDLGNQEHSLNKYRGKIVILDLFATWCPPCRMEIPHFVELQNEYKDDLAVVGLSYDQTGADKVIAFAKKLGINYDLYWGSQEIASHVGLRGIPHTLVIDQEGHVINSFVGYRDKAVFETAIKSLLKK